ncbi:MAG: uroporphyrinogen-III synthase, partial [Gammaproteobacteria bacterium]|jgi:uroporphyrinogen-III synthase
VSLSSLSVLLTRPESESKALSHLLQKERAIVVNVPMFEIEANTSQSDCDLMPRFQIAIFVSKNAARFGARAFLEASKNSVNISVLGIGPATKKTLKNMGVSGCIIPRTSYNSEGLLELLELQRTCIPKTVVIFRGNGGRELLCRGLESRGYTVEYLSCYVRREIQGGLLQKLDSSAAPDLLIIASKQALDILVSKIIAEDLTRLFDVQTLVLGSRLAAEIALSGFSLMPIVVKEFSDAHVVSTIKEWAAKSV